ncbi:HHR196Cp [Eremothecium sinecaudum]|uniref:Ribosome assembly protein 3 n=1 Tax=Eremothecium sinecaudum TaxID=45286 RepID=A0A109V0H6_9SACH|nr:HHR196Cp [Eremothecium sinecaudum]AMD22965.1 HHR196Cp [Eremothecium sinecaudum]
MVKDTLGTAAAGSSAQSKSRRRKKRRTQASDSDSSSSSSSASEAEGENEVVEEQEDDEVLLSDVEVTDDQEVKEHFNPETLNHTTLQSLNQIKLTTTNLSSKYGFQNANKVDLNEASKTIAAGEVKIQKGLAAAMNDVSGLKNEYLNMLFEHYGEDINQLRNAPDFSNKSLVMLANVLKDGGNMFDFETLKTVVENK